LSLSTRACHRDRRSAFASPSPPPSPFATVKNTSSVAANPPGGRNRPSAQIRTNRLNPSRSLEL
jgi:hypothetical protein